MRSVITTINEPTACMVTLSQYLSKYDGKLYVIGDKKGPAQFNLDTAEFYDVESQSELSFNLAGLLPFNHYARKNLGYLLALREKAAFLYETDDDNAPIEGWKPRHLNVQAKSVERSGWVNAYNYFTDELIWPRGLPLDQIRNPDAVPQSSADLATFDAPIQQGLANGSPDVDAIWRLVCDRDLTFEAQSSILLLPGTWCPFNSQSTWWWPVAYPLMYLPSYCSFRMTDIWRSFIAQRCLWELGRGVVFHAAEVHQVRNYHNLSKDFEAEVPGYTGNQNLVDILSGLTLIPGAENVGSNLLKCYEGLVAEGFFPKNELPLVGAWLNDLSTVL